MSTTIDTTTTSPAPEPASGLTVIPHIIGGERIAADGRTGAVFNPATGEKLAKIFKLGDGWIYTGSVIMGDDNTFTFVMKYADKLAPQAATPVFTQVAIPGETVVDSFNFHIDVVAEAIQADGLDTWEAAFAAFDK